jgi:hypothetical protein
MDKGASARALLAFARKFATSSSHRPKRGVHIAALIALVALLSALLPAYSSAGVNRWTTNGPQGLPVSAIVISPSAPATLYAGARGGGVFKSTNGGQSWTAVNDGLTDIFIDALAIDPSEPATLYAGGSSGLFKSTNGGQSWTTINAGLISPGAGVLAIDPSTPALSTPYRMASSTRAETAV